MSHERKRGFLRPEEDGTDVRPEKWGLPDYTAEANQTAKETALKYDPSWVPNFEQPEPEQPVELTEADIELIKENAKEQGFHQGQEAGFNAGYEKGKEQGLEAGMTEGHAKGMEEGVAAGQQFIQEQVTVFMDLANQFAQPLELMNSQVEKQLVDMVLALTKEVTHVEVQTNPQVILDTIRESVDALPISGHPITIKLHPEDAEIIHTAYGEKELDCRNWTLLTEPSLNRSDVHIEAGESSVSYKMEERLKTVLHSFCGVNRHQGND